MKDELFFNKFGETEKEFEIIDSEG